MTISPPFIPEGGSRGARANVGSPRRIALAPGALRLALGLLVCLPGGFIVLLGIALLAPGLLIAGSGITRLTEHLLRFQPERMPKHVEPVERDVEAPLSWSAPTSRMLQ